MDIILQIIDPLEVTSVYRLLWTIEDKDRLGIGSSSLSGESVVGMFNLSPLSYPSIVDSIRMRKRLYVYKREKKHTFDMLPNEN